MSNEKILNKQAFEEGVQKANAIKTVIDSLHAPEGFEFKVVGQEFRIYAPYNRAKGPGIWNTRTENSVSYSYAGVSSVNEVELKTILELLHSEITEHEKAEGYKLQMEKLFPLPVKIEEPCLTPEQQKEQSKNEKIRKIEQLIAEEIQAIELTKSLSSLSLNLDEQVSAHESELSYLRKKLKVTVAGYKYAEWNGNVYTSIDLSEYTEAIPLSELEELEKSKDMFDDFRVWVEGSDPILVGRLLDGNHRTPFIVAEW